STQSCHFSFVPPSHVLSPSRAPPPTALYTLSLHDALPIYAAHHCQSCVQIQRCFCYLVLRCLFVLVNSNCCVIRILQSVLFFLKDRKSTRLNSSHVSISYAVFCLKKKKMTQHVTRDALRAK